MGGGRGDSAYDLTDEQRCFRADQRLILYVLDEVENSATDKALTTVYISDIYVRYVEDRPQDR